MGGDVKLDLEKMKYDNGQKRSPFAHQMEAFDARSTSQ